MPTHTFISKKITLHDSKGTKPILNVFTEVAKNHGITENSELFASEERTRKGWWIKIITSAEIVSGKALGGAECTLPSCIIDLDPPAIALIKAYRNCLNELMIKSDLTSEDTEKKIIDNRFVLMREILLRIVSVALCKDMNGDRDGNLLIMILEEFIAKINSDTVLNNKEFWEKKLSILNKFFATTHKKWIGFIKNMVEIIKLLNLNTNTMSKCLLHLDNTKHVIKCQLIAEFDPLRKPSELSQDWVDMTLASCEQKFFPKIKLIQHTTSVTFHLLEAKEKYRFLQVLKVDGAKFNLNKIKNLYSLLAETELFEKVINQIEGLNKAVGWMPLMTGVLKLNKLAKALETHGGKCESFLTLEETDPIFNKPVGEGLVIYNAASGYSLGIGAKHCYQNLLTLCDPQTLAEITKFMGNTLDSLLNLEEELGFELLDQERLNGLKQLPFKKQVLELEPLAKNIISDSNSITENSITEKKMPNTSSTLMITEKLGVAPQPQPVITNSNQMSVEHTLLVHDYSKPPLIRQLIKNEKSIYRLLTTSDGKLLCGLIDTNLAVNFLNVVIPFFSINYLHLWNPANDTWNNFLPLHGANCRVNAFATLSNNEILIATYSDGNTGKLYWWHPSQNAPIRITNATTPTFCVLGVFPDNTVLLPAEDTFSRIKKIQLWNLKFDVPLNTFEESSYLEAVEVLSKELFAGCSERTIRIWNKHHTKSIKILNGHAAKIVALKKISDTILASGSKDMTIKLWNINTGLCEKTLKHSAPITAITLLSNNRLASSDTKGTICVWNCNDGICEQTIPIQHKGKIYCLATFPDGKLVSGGYDGCIYIYNFPELKQQETKVLTSPLPDAPDPQTDHSFETKSLKH